MVNNKNDVNKVVDPYESDCLPLITCYLTIHEEKKVVNHIIVGT